MTRRPPPHAGYQPLEEHGHERGTVVVDDALLGVPDEVGVVTLACVICLIEMWGVLSRVTEVVHQCPIGWSRRP